MKQPDWRWPHWTWPAGKRIAVVFNVCLEAWSDGKAPGISPMGNPLPAGALDTMAISWAAYGVEVGIHRLMDGLANHGAKASVMVNAIIAEHSPQTVRDVAARGTSKPSTPKLLAKAGYRWYGDVFDFDLPRLISYGNSTIVAIPLSYDVNDMPSMKYGHPPRMMLESYIEVIEIARAASELRIIDVTCHAHIFGHHRGAYFYEKIIEQAISSPDIWVATRAEIADHVLSVMPA